MTSPEHNPQDESDAKEPDLSQFERGRAAGMASLAGALLGTFRTAVKKTFEGSTPKGLALGGAVGAICIIALATCSSNEEEKVEPATTISDDTPEAQPTTGISIKLPGTPGAGLNNPECTSAELIPNNNFFGIERSILTVKGEKAVGAVYFIDGEPQEVFSPFPEPKIEGQPKDTVFPLGVPTSMKYPDISSLSVSAISADGQLAECDITIK